MSNQQNTFSLLLQLGNCIQDFGFRVGILSGCGLVKDIYRNVSEQCAGKGDPLPLPA